MRAADFSDTYENHDTHILLADCGFSGINVRRSVMG
jgi:hypothetical protein